MTDEITFTLKENPADELYELLKDIDVEKTPAFTISDTHGNIAEYLKVIRCKDCEHLKVSGELEHTNGDTTFYYICDYWHRATDEWRYCDQGTRRNEQESNDASRKI